MESPGTGRGFRVEQAGDQAVLLRFGDAISEDVNARVVAAAAAVEARSPAWLVDLVPAYASLLVVYDPVAVEPDAVETFLRRLAGEAPGPAPGPSGGRLVTIPVRYGGEDGPDLASVAGECGMTPDEVVRIHLSGSYRVYMLGFKPGFPYMGILDGRLRLPRLPAPRTRVPAGSVAIAGAQTGVYPVESPGGWRLLGRTDLRLFDPSRPEPFLLRPGDRIRFEAVG